MSTEARTCPTCGSDCNERDELIKAEREIERLTAEREAIRALLPDAYFPGSKDWAQGDLKQRVECLKTWLSDAHAEASVANFAYEHVTAERDALADSCEAKADRIDRLGEMVERVAAERDALRAALAAAPLTRQQIHEVMTEHYPLDSLLRENVEHFEACVRRIERAHGIGTDAAPAPAPPDEWIVCNRGTDVADGLTYTEALQYLTPKRLARGWFAVCVVDMDSRAMHAARAQAQGGKP